MSSNTRTAKRIGQIGGTIFSPIPGTGYVAGEAIEEVGKMLEDEEEVPMPEEQARYGEGRIRNNIQDRVIDNPGGLNIPLRRQYRRADRVADNASRQFYRQTERAKKLEDMGMERLANMAENKADRAYDRHFKFADWKPGDQGPLAYRMQKLFGR